MDSVSKTTLLETIDTATEYSKKLEKNLNLVLKAEQQVTGTANDSIAEVDAAFDDLTKSIFDAINKRRETLKSQIEKIKEEGLLPLRACREMIKQKLKTTQNYICEGQDLLDQSDSMRIDIERCLKYLDQSSLLGSLPAVPSMEEVPCITVQLNVGALRSGLVGKVLSTGTVNRMGPVQITSVSEKPGALLVHWEEVEDRGVDEPCYRLQLASGAHPEVRQSGAVYRDVYEGAETCRVVRDLRPGVSYTLRVTSRDQWGDWGPWSLPRVALTTIPPFRWSSKSCHYATTVEGKIATKTDRVKEVLLSSDRQLGPDNSIEFTVLECPESRQPSDGVALVDGLLEVSDSLMHRGTLFVSTAGCVFVDGVEKTTRLPALVRGSRVTFVCESLSAGRVRVHVDSGDKAVTYDWRVASTSLHFATLCSAPGWKLMVE